MRDSRFLICDCRLGGPSRIPHSVTLSSLALLAFVALCGCPDGSQPRSAVSPPSDPSAGRIVVFCAGSLALPLDLVKARYEAQFPDREVSIEPSGSRLALRKWVQLGRHVDVVALADRYLITDEAMPEDADWCVTFAGNRMVVAFTERAKLASQISEENWMEVLSRPGVLVGRSDPNMDPCGYRAIMVLRLADLFYPPERGGGQIEKRVLANSPPTCVRPKSTELAALLQAKHLDYAFMYKSCAQHCRFPSIPLPAEIDLSDPAKDESYGRVSVRASGKRPGQTVEYRGRAIAYGVTVPRSGRRRAGEEFVAFLLGPEGRAVFQANGQPFLAHFEVAGPLPERLRSSATAQRE